MPCLRTGSDSSIAGRICANFRLALVTNRNPHHPQLPVSRPNSLNRVPASTLASSAHPASVLPDHDEVAVHQALGSVLRSRLQRERHVALCCAIERNLLKRGCGEPVELRCGLGDADDTAAGRRHRRRARRRQTNARKAARERLHFEAVSAWKAMERMREELLSGDSVSRLAACMEPMESARALRPKRISYAADSLRVHICRGLCAVTSRARKACSEYLPRHRAQGPTL